LLYNKSTTNRISGVWLLRRFSPQNSQKCAGR